ncbi:MAG: PepSY-associated TM helix domain-containing protein, partial [Psychrobium sp.]
MSFNIRWIVSSKLNQWCWRWHVIAGLCSLPFIMLLTITGILYLFKEDVNHYLYGHMQHIEAATTSPLSYQQQLEAVVEETSRPIESVTLPNDVSQATAFRLKGKGRTRHLIYINPYTGELLGEYKQQDTLMYKVRKLHGELLLDTPGTLIVELVASWFIVLLITGISLGALFLVPTFNNAILGMLINGSILTLIFWTPIIGFKISDDINSLLNMA